MADPTAGIESLGDLTGKRVLVRSDLNVPLDGSTISDDGRGFNYHDIPGRRLGVRVSIVENIEAIGGAVDLDTAPGRGTRVTLTWPKDATA